MANEKNKEINFIKKGIKNRINLFLGIEKKLFLLMKYFIPIILFFPVFSRTNENTFSEITIRTIGPGNQTIFRKINTNNLCSMPDEIIDIDDNTTFNASYCDDESELCIITTNKPESNITMKWYNKLNSTCKEMFKGLTNIIEVDLSKMRISLYDMSNLFKDCSSLTKINLTKVDTTKTTDLSNMFANCVSLSSLNLSSFRTYLSLLHTSY